VEIGKICGCQNFETPMSTTLPHDCNGKHVFNVVRGVCQSDIFCFRATTLLPLNLVVNWTIFTVSIVVEAAILFFVVTVAVIVRWVHITRWI